MKALKSSQLKKPVYVKYIREDMPGFEKDVRYLLLKQCEDGVIEVEDKNGEVRKVNSEDFEV